MKILESTESQNVIESFKALCEEKMNKPNMFIMPYDSNNHITHTYIEKVLSLLKKDFKIDIFELSLRECNLSNSIRFPSSLSFKCITIDSGRPEKIRDILKEVLWPTNNDVCELPTIHDLLSGSEGISSEPFKLSEYGIFVPYITKKFGDIHTHSFSHKPVFYRYRVAVEKTKQLPAKLELYLQLLFTDCPNHLFQKSEFRASARTCDDCKIEVQIVRSQEHELIKLAKKSLSINQFKSRHENLQKFFLLNDPCTVACEVPTWLESSELKDYLEVFRTEDTLTGHIDILRYENDGEIGIWDYKPGASEETDGATQVFLYALMLSVRTGASLKNIVCGCFDESDVLFFRPSEAQIAKS